jgi:hypothetical protein
MATTQPKQQLRDDELPYQNPVSPRRTAMRVHEFLLSIALLCALGLAGQAQAPTPAPATPPTRTLRTVPNFVTATDQIMRAPQPENWLIYRGNYQAWG